MRAASQQAQEWIDGFLFVANRPILDLLNTKPVLAEGPTELLPDVRALERWLIASGTMTSAKARPRCVAGAIRPKPRPSWSNSSRSGRGCGRPFCGSRAGLRRRMLSSPK